MWHKLYLLVLCALNIHHEPSCRLNTRTHFREPLPIIIRNGKLLEPTDSFGTVEMNAGETITLSCEGAGSIIHPNVIRQETTATIRCEAGDNFKNDDWLSSPAQFSLFRCSYPPNHFSSRTNRTCFNEHTVIEVGYRVERQFYPVFESCFNELTYSVIYSKYTQKPYNSLFQTKVDRPFFVANDNFGIIPIDTLFSPRGQKAAIAQLVGPMIENYITKNELLSRGHLAAKTDFVYAFSERATFHYVNCAPQWTGFNGGNWNTLEVDLRNHIHSAGYNTIVYTGVFGVTQLYNNLGRRVDLYLTTDENNNPIIPVPQYFYKVVYEPDTLRGIAFVGVNNPYYTSSEFEILKFCDDVCRNRNKYNWLTWHPDNPSEGYTFCCTVPDFRAVVDHLPSFEVRSLLQ